MNALTKCAVCNYSQDSHSEKTDHVFITWAELRAVHAEIPSGDYDRPEGYYHTAPEIP